MGSNLDGFSMKGNVNEGGRINPVISIHGYLYIPDRFKGIKEYDHVNLFFKRPYAIAVRGSDEGEYTIRDHGVVSLRGVFRDLGLQFIANNKLVIDERNWDYSRKDGVLIIYLDEYVGDYLEDKRED